MESDNLEVLYTSFHRKMAKISLDYKRYLYEKINGHKNRIPLWMFGLLY